ncbi:hypothetical protein [Lichenifustis flavocetrariae]|uniref:Uncharacterized protein n=1 Tax=Lichenifustis flavocetrariae TaxID=2949735 RepID=A0AA41YRR5_9HYPH|nr:hypothetical protein [Lichenifustis flavocetrariae]MCW6506969.1 hypothetical protein [Lichenifustis flavocetrariae]
MSEDVPALFPETKSVFEMRKQKEQAYEWPLAAALIWIVWRNIHLANTEWAAYCEAGTLTWGAADLSTAACPPAEAESVLHEGLRTGDIRAYGQRLEDPDPVAILPHQWAVLFLENSIPQAPDGFYSVLVQAADVKRLMKDNPGARSAFMPVDRDPGLKKMGRPAVYDWPAAAGFAAKYMLDNHPLSVADLTLVLHGWFEKRGKAPDRRDVERFASQALAE